MARPVPELGQNGGSELECNELRVSYGDRTVLSDVSLRVPPGSLTAVIGASGSGKSTLLRAIGGFAPVASGTVRLSGVDITGVVPEHRQIGSLFQNARLFPALDVRSNVAFGLKVRGVDEAERNETAERLLSRVGLAERRLDAVGALSGGEQQRVALARALAYGPSLVLMDEPFSAVDTPRRRDLRRLVGELLTEHATTAVLVTHDIADATFLADRIAVLDNGALLQEGPVGEVIANPANDVAAELMAGSAEP